MTACIKLPLRMKKTLLSIAALLSLSLSAARAQNLAYNGYPGESDGHFFVGLASGTLGGTPVNMFCIDALDDVSPGQSWTVNKLSLNTAGPIITPLNPAYPSLTVQDYQAMILLGDQFTGSNPLDSELQHAIWSFSNPSSFPLTGDTQAQTLKADALASVGGYDFSNAFVLVPTSTINGSAAAAQIFEMGAASALAAGATPGAPAPPVTACIAFAAVLILQAFRSRGAATL